jgi:hypothetical protein
VHMLGLVVQRAASDAAEAKLTEFDAVELQVASSVSISSAISRLYGESESVSGTRFRFSCAASRRVTWD